MDAKFAIGTELICACIPDGVGGKTRLAHSRIGWA
jgi:hypothetical protein